MMTEKQAREEHLYFTGMWVANWDREKAEQYKQRAAELRKKYGIRLVQVKDGNGWSYYADENYDLVAHDKETTLKNRIDRIEERRKAINDKWQKELAELEECFEKEKEDYAKIQELKERVKK